ncbi:GNAT family N-acetyltransferase [Pseudonocardia sp. TRM90224]|uniref:GNAT family N-acetyltransferase n=1 Tax=Pseudonocardia sp. TRM90224 TaxID=2812678 RepID=UPI001E2E6F22|nr:GNAT family N-acetyltransferase [Pseudonocardia sp. TRM90224]
MRIYLETDRLVLRRMTEADVDDLLALSTDPDVMRYLTPTIELTAEEIRTEHIPNYRRWYDTTPGFGYWAAIERATGTFLGWFFLRPPAHDPAPGEVELGYRLNKAAWGRGFGAEGARAVVEKGFAEFGVERVVAWTMTINTGSRRVMEKAGLRFVKTFDDPDSVGIEGAEHGDVEYALTRAEWAVAQAAQVS